MKIKLHDDDAKKKKGLDPEKTPIYCAAGLIVILIIIGIIITVNSSKDTEATANNQVLGTSINPVVNEENYANGSVEGDGSMSTVTNPDGTVTVTTDSGSTDSTTTAVSSGDTNGIIVDDGQGGSIEILPDTENGEMAIIPNTNSASSDSGTDSNAGSTTDSGTGSTTGTDSGNTTDDGGNDESGVIELPFVPASALEQ